MTNRELQPSYITDQPYPTSQIDAFLSPEPVIINLSSIEISQERIDEVSFCLTSRNLNSRINAVKRYFYSYAVRDSPSAQIVIFSSRNKPFSRMRKFQRKDAAFVVVQHIFFTFFCIQHLHFKIFYQYISFHR